MLDGVGAITEGLSVAFRREFEAAEIDVDVGKPLSVGETVDGLAVVGEAEGCTETAGSGEAFGAMVVGKAVLLGDVVVGLVVVGACVVGVTVDGVIVLGNEVVGEAVVGEVAAMTC